MEFNLDKCEVMHFGRSHKGRTYSVNGRALGRVIEQRDLGVHVHSSLKVESQVDRVVKKAFSMLGFIGHNIEYRSCWYGHTGNTVYSSGHPVIVRILLN